MIENKRKSGACRLCGSEGPLVESHIVPEFMYGPVYKDHRMVGFARSGGTLKPKTYQMGFREPLLCRRCDQFLNHSYEQPNVTTWRALIEGGDRPGLSRSSNITREGTIYINIKGVDYASFKLLLLSILWRASIAEREEYASVHLGSHEESIRKMLLAQDPGPQLLYPCVLTLLNRPVRLMSPVVPGRYGMHSTYQVIITSAVLWFFISPFTHSEPMLETAVDESGSLQALVAKPEELPVFIETMARIAQIKAQRQRKIDT
ncbi:MAG TPA: hypothetical protein VF789_16185 [Thermoanaerobaculia bacterium]